MSWTKKLLLILEVVALFIVGSLLGRFLGKLLGIRKWVLQVAEMTSPGNVDFMGIAQRELANYTLKYGSIFLLVMLALLLIRKKPKKYFAFTTNGHSITYLIKTGILLFCISGFIPKLFMGLWTFGWVGEGPAGWQLFKEPWDAGFWLYALISAMLIPPFVEELFFRGYAQKRFQDGFSVGVSILLMALMFAAFHTQYYQLSVISIHSLIMLVVSSLILGYSRYITGSILPGMLAHLLVNTPIFGIPSMVLSGLMLIYVLFRIQTVKRHYGRFVTLFRTKGYH